MQDKVNEHLKHKIPVEVVSVINFNGRIRPIRLRTENGDVLRISKIKDYRHCAALIAGGVGWRYTVEIYGEEGKEFFLFQDDEGPFFLED